MEKPQILRELFREGVGIRMQLSIFTDGGKLVLHLPPHCRSNLSVRCLVADDLLQPFYPSQCELPRCWKEPPAAEKSLEANVAQVCASSLCCSSFFQGSQVLEKFRIELVVLAVEQAIRFEAGKAGLYHSTSEHCPLVFFVGVAEPVLSHCQPPDPHSRQPPQHLCLIRPVVRVGPAKMS